MSISMGTQRNKLMYLENTLVMYGIYNAETLENLVKRVHALQSRHTLYERLFAGQTLKHIQKCMVHAVFNITQLTLFYIYE